MSPPPVGGSHFGLLRVLKEHQPQLPPLELLRRFWPLTRDVMAHQNDRRRVHDCTPQAMNCNAPR
jgi:hypothetical protein